METLRAKARVLNWIRILHGDDRCTWQDVFSEESNKPLDPLLGKGLESVERPCLLWLIVLLQDPPSLPYGIVVDCLGGGGQISVCPEKLGDPRVNCRADALVRGPLDGPRFPVLGELPVCGTGEPLLDGAGRI